MRLLAAALAALSLAAQAPVKVGLKAPGISERAIRAHLALLPDLGWPLPAGAWPL